MRGAAKQPKGARDRLLPIVATAFAELGYRRATTAEIARRCGVRENVLYRVWPDKKQMFVAAIEYVSALSFTTWEQVLAEPGRGSPAERLLAYEATHHGEFGLYRIVFAGLSETDDRAIREALQTMYRRFHDFICRQLSPGEPASDVAATLAWALIGLGTVSNISRELSLMPQAARHRLFRIAGAALIHRGID